MTSFTLAFYIFISGLLERWTDTKGRLLLFLSPRISCSDSFAVPNEVVRGGFPSHTHTSLALCCGDTAHGATCVFQFVQKEYNCHANRCRMAANSSSRSRGFSGYDFATRSDFQNRIQSDLILGLYWGCQSHFVFFIIWLHMVLLCGCRCVWSSPCTVLEVITIRPRLVGVIWSSLKLSPGDDNVEVGRNLGPPLWWMSPGSGQGTTTMDRALNAPPIEEMDEWPLIIHRKTHSCIHTDKCMRKSNKHPSVHNWVLILSFSIGCCFRLDQTSKINKAGFFFYTLFIWRYCIFLCN